MTIEKSKIKFEEYFVDDENGMVTAYFNVPKSWLPRKYKDAKYATVSIEHPLFLPEANMCTVMISPTRQCEPNFFRRIFKEKSYEDYDWTDWDLSYEDIEKFLDIADSKSIVELLTGFRKY